MRTIYSVGQVNRYIRSMFTSDGVLAGIYVRGEVSNCKYHSSGHLYFSLKDQSGTISCVMFAGDRRGLSFRLKDGDRIVAGGRIDVYERAGSYQLYAKEIQLEGEGLLFERYNRLKKKLDAEGLFDPSHKKAIPPYAMRIGVVTASTGAAIRDIQNISHRRNPYVEVILCPAQVQGEGAAQSVVRGIRALDGLVDILIVGRGGGSIEDLWAFNEEIVARAIYDCATPVISAVGHQTDTTIADFVADRAAPTPSAAAELAVFDADKFRRDILERRRALSISVSSKMRHASLHADWYADKLRARSPQSILMKQKMISADLERSLGDQMERRLTDAKLHGESLQRALTDRMPVLLMRDQQRSVNLRDAAEAALKARLLQRRHTFELLAATYEAQNPLKKLASGYSYMENADRRPIKSIAQVARGDRVRIYVTDGVVSADVTDVDESGISDIQR